MKKILIMALVTSFIVSSLTGCGNSDNNSNSNNTSINNNTNSNNNNNSANNTTNVSTQTPISVDQVSTSDLFTDRDFDTDFYDSSYSTIDLSNASCDSSNVTIANNVFTITTEGTYLVTGSMSDGQIVIDVASDEKVQLMLDNVTLSNSSTAPIYVTQADKVFITMQEGSTNTLTATLVEDETATTNIDGVIFAHDDIVLNGNGVLNITATNGNGIVSKDDLKITSGEYNVKADKHGIEANDSIRIADGEFNITASKDGLHVDDEDVEKGYIYILDGEFNIDVDGDGFDSSSYITIVDGNYNIKTGGGYANAPVKVAEQNNGGGGMMRRAISTLPIIDNFPITIMMNGGMGGQGQQGQQGEMGQQGQMQGEMGQQGQMGEMTEEMMAQREEMMAQREEMMGMMTDPTEGNRGEMTEEMMAQREEMMEQMQGQQNTMTTPNTTTTSTDDDVSRKGIKSGGDLTIHAGSFDVDTYDDAFHSNNNFTINNGDFNIGTADDALHADFNLTVNDGKFIMYNCHEGLEGQSIDIFGGYFDIKCNDDGFNAASSSNGDIYINIAGGEIYIDGTLECDGIDSNGNLFISGGYIQISGTTETRDTVIDFQNTGTITGGTVIATGSNSATLQNFGSDSTQGSIVVSLASFQTGKVTLTDSKGNVLVDITPPKAYQAVTISMPEITVGETYTLVSGDITTEIKMDSLIYGSGSQSGRQR